MTVPTQSIGTRLKLLGSLCYLVSMLCVETTETASLPLS